MKAARHAKFRAAAVALIFQLPPPFSVCALDRTGTDIAPLQVLVPWLLETGDGLADLPFPEVVLAATGKKIIRVDPVRDKVHLESLAGAVRQAVARINEGGHPTQGPARINEASSHIEDEILLRIAALPGWQAEIPPTASGRIQRSGYPDIMATAPDGTIFYLDPKLFAGNSRNSTLRTFYYEPKTATNKIGQDARHLLVGITHNGKPGPDLRLLSWELFDLYHLQVRLKAEFQASNRELYATEGRLLGSREEINPSQTNSGN